MEDQNLALAPEPDVEEEPVAVRDPDKVWRLLKLLPVDGDDTSRLWDEVGELESRYSSLAPDADEIGEVFGEGTYLCLRATERYYVKTVKVVAAVQYREADDDEETTAA